MKHILILIAALSTLGVLAPTTAQADHGTRIVSYTSCGRPIYAVYQICGYDRCGHPIGHWVTQHVSCGCSVCNPRPVYQPSYGGHSHYSQPSYGYHFGSSSRSSCDNHQSSGGFHFSFGRR
jgi:hypothetical protein